MIPALIAIAARIGVPEPARKMAAWIGVAIAAAAFIAACIWAWNAWLDGEREEAVRVEQVKREGKTAQAGQQSAEERADAYVQDKLAEQNRDAAVAKADAAEAAKPPEARATLSPQEQALACERLRQAKLTSGPKFKELCL